jgi:hypothetical protein
VAERSGYWHGRKSRRLTLRTGTVHVGVRRARLVDVEGSEWQSQLVPRYRRSILEVEQSVLGVYLSGSNTRRIPCPRAVAGWGRIIEKHGVAAGAAVGRKLSRLAKRRDLAEHYWNLAFGAYIPIRTHGATQCRPQCRLPLRQEQLKTRNSFGLQA